MKISAEQIKRHEELFPTENGLRVSTFLREIELGSDRVTGIKIDEELAATAGYIAALIAQKIENGSNLKDEITLFTKKLLHLIEVI